MSYLILTDDNDNTYNFPEGFWFQMGEQVINSNVVNKSFAAGGQNVADGFLRSSTVTISGTLQGDTISTFEVKRRAMMQAVIKGGKLSRSEDPVDRNIEIRYAGITPGLAGGDGDGQLEEISIVFVAEYPMWKDTAETTVSNTVTGDDTITIPVGSSDFLVKPIIQVNADQAVDLPGIKMTNKSDGATQFTYNDQFFTSGDNLAIDTDRATVKRNGGSTVENFDGNFLRLQPGDNIIDYEGPACTIVFVFKKVYL